MAPSYDAVDHGRASKVLDGVLFAMGDDGDDEDTAEQPFLSQDGAKEPTKDGDASTQAVSGMTGKPDGQHQDENKENKAPEDQNENQQTNDNSLDGRVQVRREDKPNKKKKSKGGRSKGAKKRGTGFENYYCDPPLTPAEAKNEKTTIYAPDRAFVDRIEDCVQRYRARRRLDNTKENIFNKYLNLGGIDTAQRMFQGMKSINYEDNTADEIRDMTADAVIHRGIHTDVRFYNPNESDSWDVDFSGVVAGFFSERVFKLVGTDMGLIQMAVDVVTNFLNYVLHHDVCPEYTKDILKAKEICSSVVDQITRTFHIVQDTPDDLSRACYALFNGHNTNHAEYDNWDTSKHMVKEHAQRVFSANVAVHEVLYDKVKGTTVEEIEIVHQVMQHFEVEHIALPTEEHVRQYLGVKDEHGVTGNIKPCGLLTAKAIDLVTGWDTGDRLGPAPGIEAQEVFVVGANVLEQLIVGMKVKLVVCILNNGVKFIRDIYDVHPTYYTFLPQELMLRYREPTPNDRPAPSTENPDVDEEGDVEDKEA